MHKETLIQTLAVKMTYDLGDIFIFFIHLLSFLLGKLNKTDFFLTAIINEMKRVQLKIQEEKEKEKRIYAKMFA